MYVECGIVGVREVRNELWGEVDVFVCGGKSVDGSRGVVRTFTVGAEARVSDKLEFSAPVAALATAFVGEPVACAATSSGEVSFMLFREAGVATRAADAVVAGCSPTCADVSAEGHVAVGGAGGELHVLEAASSSLRVSQSMQNGAWLRHASVCERRAALTPLPCVELPDSRSGISAVAWQGSGLLTANSNPSEQFSMWDLRAKGPVARQSWAECVDRYRRARRDD
jgi:hypothetical protein